MITLRTRIQNGKISSVVKNEITAFMQMYEGKEVEIILKKARSKRSDPQNRYYWGCVVPIVCQELKNLGHRLTKEECHEWLKLKFNYKSVSNQHGELIGDVPQSTTSLTKTEFGEYIERIAQWSAEILNIVIPEPNTQVEFQL